MRNLISLVILLLLLVPVQSGAQDRYKTLPAGTQVNLVMLEEIHSNRNREGDEVLFAVREDVTLLGETYLVEGTPVVGVISRARPARSWGRGGYIDAEIISIAPVYNLPINLVGSHGESGGSDVGTSIGATIIIGVSVVGVLAGGALSGDTAVIDAGTELTVFTGEGGQVLDIPPVRMRQEVVEWYESKVKATFLNYTWDDNPTVADAMMSLGYEVDSSSIRVEEKEDYVWFIDVQIHGGERAEFTLQPWEEPYIGKWITLEPYNYNAHRIMDAVSGPDKDDEDILRDIF